MRGLCCEVSVREAPERDSAHEGIDAIALPSKGRNEDFREGLLAVMMNPKLRQHGLSGLAHGVKQATKAHGAPGLRSVGELATRRAGSQQGLNNGRSFCKNIVMIAAALEHEAAWLGSSCAAKIDAVGPNAIRSSALCLPQSQKVRQGVIFRLRREIESIEQSPQVRRGFREGSHAAPPLRRRSNTR
jgi:hypothetical protein